MITSTSNRANVGKVLAMAVLVTAIAASLGLASGPAYASTTFYVNSVADHADANLGVPACDTGYVVERDGGGQEAECTLRAAMEQANYTPGADTVKFAIPGGGVKTIAPASDLPRIAEALTVDGYTQPGASPNTKAVGSDAVLKIELRGPGNGHGLVVDASNSTVRGLVINSSGEGIRITGSGATGNRVEGNYLGTDPSGTQKLGNGDYGVTIGGAPNNTIGGTTPGARNLISGNLGGVGIEGNGATGNKVTGNYIGTDRNGTADLGNSSSGVLIEGAPGNTVGGTAAGMRNVISGNDAYGVQIQGGGAKGNEISGNYVGTDRTGAAPLENSDGVLIDGAPNNTVGGTTVGARNVISGNDSEGVLIVGPDATGNKVAGNYVGTGAAGQRVPGQNDTGITIVNAANNVVGGTEAGARNTISGNGTGVVILGVGATGNRVLSNSIFGNANLGIDLYGALGPNPNDPDDKDAGPNGLQNRPLLSSARKSATGTTTVTGKLDSTPNKTYLVQFFSNPEGGDEGKTILGSARVSTGGSGDASFAFSTRKAIRLGQNTTATATNTSTNNTSEFSAPRKVVAR